MIASERVAGATDTLANGDGRGSTPDLVLLLKDLRRAAGDLAEAHPDEIEVCAPEERLSAANLLHYLALRQHDLRPLQRQLARRGLSSLGRAEGHVLATLDAVLAHLDPTGVAERQQDRPVSMDEAAALLERQATRALGPPASGGPVRLMVTLPAEAATDLDLVGDLLNAGMDIARINCAHDGPDQWRAMAHNVRRMANDQGRSVRVAFDLAGPKLRTTSLGAGAAVVRSRPRRGPTGDVEQPAQVRFVVTALGIDSSTACGATGVLTVPLVDLQGETSAVGDAVILRDARGRKRRFSVTATDGGWVEAASDRTCYFVPGLAVRIERAGRTVAVARIGELPRTDAVAHVQRGQTLRIVRVAPAANPAPSTSTSGVEPAEIGCDLPEVFTAVQPGHRILLDDGKIETVVMSVTNDAIEAVVVRPGAAKLKAEKGINLPDTDLPLPALTSDDLDALDTIAELADFVSLSFVSNTEDLIDLRAALDERERPDLAIGLKIEHAAAFKALPSLLLHALQRPPVAIMLARGDLAVEVGFERLAEVQEEILWMCEAAHIPVIWATQVLESMAKGGVPTRAEVTDAAWASRAECVMLNKGPHIVEAMAVLKDILGRMNEHQDKRTPMLRRLSVATALGVPSAD